MFLHIKKYSRCN